MSVPAKRRSRSKARRGRAHDALRKVKLIACSKCGSLKKPHQVCPTCGHYKGREVIAAKTKKTSKK